MPVTDWYISLDHPASQGHFPDNPIIPGAVVLRDALRAIEKQIGPLFARCQIRSAKFLHPVRPGDRIELECTSTDGGEVRFACRIGARVVLTGQVQCHAMSSMN